MTLYDVINHGRFLSIALLVFTKKGLASSSILDFNCLRSGSDCVLQSHCDISTGKCQCLYPSTTRPSTVDATSNATDLTFVNFTSFDYQCKMFTVNPASCGPRGDCSYHGNCSDELGACVCEEGYYGEECDLPRVQVACSPSGMFINVTPHGNFRGSIYILHKKQESDCNLNNTVSRNVSSFVIYDYFDLEGWHLTINHVDATCGNASSKKDPTMSDVYIYRREFLIQYSEDIETSLDQLIAAECRVSMEGANISFGDISVQDVNKPYESIDVSDESTANVTLTVEHQAGSAPNGTTFNLGDEMDLIFRMQKSSHSTYTDFKINKCAASNHDNRLQTVTMIDDECFDGNIRALFLSDANNTPLISNHSATNSNPVIVLKLKAFLFSGHGSTGQVTLLCNVHFCEDRCPHRANCNSRRQRRRSAERDKEVAAVITVVDPVDRSKDMTEELMTQQCRSDPAFVGAVATMSAVIFILTIVCAVLSTKFMTLRQKKASKAGAKLTKKTAALRIPRLFLTSPGSNSCDCLW